MTHIGPLKHLDRSLKKIFKVNVLCKKVFETACFRAVLIGRREKGKQSTWRDGRERSIRINLEGVKLAANEHKRRTLSSRNTPEWTRRRRRTVPAAHRGGFRRRVGVGEQLLPAKPLDEPSARPPDAEFCLLSDGSEWDGSVLETDTALSAASGDTSGPSMSTSNFSEELDFRLIFEDDGRHAAGNLRVILATAVSNICQQRQASGC